LGRRYRSSRRRSSHNYATMGKTPAQENRAAAKKAGQSHDKVKADAAAEAARLKKYANADLDFGNKNRGAGMNKKVRCRSFGGPGGVYIGPGKADGRPHADKRSTMIPASAICLIVAAQLSLVWRHRRRCYIIPTLSPLRCCSRRT
jgi:hypothetical protein